MTLEEAIHRRLAAETDVVALIGDANHFRLYRQIVPQHGLFPCAVMQRTSTLRNVAQCGTVGTTQAIMQVDSYGKTPAQAWDVAEAIKLSLLDFSGTIGDVRIKAASLQNEFDASDPEPGLYRRSQSWSLWFVNV